MRTIDIICGENKVSSFRGKKLNYIISILKKKKYNITYYGLQSGSTSNRIADHCGSKEYGVYIKIILISKEDIALKITPAVVECLLESSVEEKFGKTPEGVERSSKECLKGVDQTILNRRKVVLKRYLNYYSGVI